MSVSGWRMPASIIVTKLRLKPTSKTPSLGGGPSLLVDPQRDDWVDSCRSQRGNETGDEPGDAEQRGDGDEHDGIERADAVEQPRKRARERERNDEAAGGAISDEQHALPHHEPQCRGRVGTERHAHAKFPRTLSDRVRHHAVNADDG